MNLSHAPADQLAKAKAATVAFKALGLGYARVYTSWNSKTKKVRVKFYATARFDAKTECKVRDIGFVGYRPSFTCNNSAVGYF